MRPFLTWIATLVVATIVPAAQTADRSTPPIAQAPTEGFTVRRLNGPVTIDGRSWIAAEPIYGSKTVRAPSGRFTLTFDEAKKLGDVVRWRLSYAAGGPPILLDPHVSYVYITPDSRWIVLEPIDVIDVTNWRRYALSKTFDVTPYIVIRAISADARRLYATRQPCPFDCRDLPNDHYEVTFPAR